MSNMERRTDTIAVPDIPWCAVCKQVACECAMIRALHTCARCGVDNGDPCGAEFVDPSMRCLLYEL